MSRVRLAASLLACLAPGALALPQDGVVTHGDGSVTQTAPDRMVIEQRSGRMAAEFSSFDIAAQERVDVLQPGRDAVFLGRVTGHDATAIFGTLSANGSVILMNPRGVVFGPTARVETASLVATSLGVDVDAFMSGALELEFSADVAGRILNQGVLEAASGGGVALLGDEVVNEGLIVAELGRVDLASGSEAVLRFDAEGLVGVAVQGGALGGTGGPDAVRNAGTVEAPGGRIVLTADAARELFSSAVNNEGVLRANAAREVDGEIVLFSRADTVTSGTLEATSATGPGGRIDVLGDRVALTGGVVDASGGAGGGRVRVGGGLAGDPSVPAARVTRVGADATLRASATEAGDGGEVIVWSETATAFEGRVEARGAGTGDGGFTELSSRGRLVFDGEVDLSAPEGSGGRLLFDPLDLEVRVGGDTDLVGAPSDGNDEVFGFAEDSGTTVIDPQAILDLLDLGTDVTLQAERDVLVADAIDASGSATPGGGLTLQGGRDIRIDAGIVLRNGDLVLSANDPLGTQSGSGRVQLNAALDTGTGAVELRQNGSSAAALLVAPIVGGALTLDGSTALSADVLTAGAQAWNGPVTLLGDVALTAADAPITLQAVDGAAALALDSGTGTLRLEGPVGSGTPLGAVAVNGTGDLQLLDAFAADSLVVGDAAALTLGGTLTLGAGGGSLTADTLAVDDAVTSVGALALTATTGALAIAAGADLAADAGLAFAAAGGIDLAADLATAGGTLTVTDPLRLGGSVLLDAAGGDLTLDAVTGNGFDLGLVSGGGSTRVTGAVDGVGTLALQADDASSTGAVRFEDAVSATALTTFARPHALAFTGATTRFTDPVTVRTTGTLTLGDGGDVLDFDAGLDASAPATRLAGTVRSAGTDLTFGTLTLDGDGALTTGPGGGSLRLDGPVDGAFVLGLDAGAGDVAIAGPVGGSTTLDELAVTAAAEVTLGAIRADALSLSGATGLLRTTGAIEVGAGGVALDATDVALEATLTTTGGGAVTLDAADALTVDAPVSAGGDLLLDAGGTLTIAADLASTGGALRLATDARLGADVALATGGGDLELDAVNGAFALGLDAGGGALVLGPVGATTPLAGLSVTGTGTTALGGDLSTTGSGGIDLAGAGAVTLLSDVRLDASVGDGGVTLAGADVDGAFRLELDGGAGGVRLGRFGATTPLAALGAAGAITLAGDGATTGALRLTGPALVDADLTLTGGTLRFDGALTGDGSRALGLAGPLVLDGPVTGLASLAVDGPATVAADVTTTGLQTWNGAVTLAGGDRTLRGGIVRLASVAGAGDALTVAGALDLRGAATGLSALTVSGAATVAGDVVTGGAQDWLGPVTLEGATRTLTGTTIRLADAGGALGTEALVLDGFLETSGALASLGTVTALSGARLAGDVATAGEQRWTGPTTLLGGDRTLTASRVVLDGPLGTEGTVGALIDGALDLNAPVTGLASLEVTGPAALAADVTTTGAQQWRGAVELEAGARTLTGTTVRLGDVVGNDLDLTVAGALELAGTASGLGAVVISGGTTLAGTLAGAGAQDFGGPLGLTGDSTLAASSIRLPGLTGAGHDLLVDGELILAGAATGLGALTVTGTARLGANVSGSGEQRWQGPVLLEGGARTLTASRVLLDALAGGGLGLTVDGALETGGALTDLARLTVTGDAVVGGDVGTTGAQDWLGRLAPVDGNRTLTGTVLTLEGGVLGSGAGLTLSGELLLGADATDLAALTVTGDARLAGDVTTTGVQRYLGETLLAGDRRTLGASRVELGRLRGGGQTLAVLGALTLSDAATGLAALTVSDAVLLGADVTTAGLQRYDDVVTLGGGDRILQGTRVTLAELVGAGSGLTVGGALTLGGPAAGLASLDVAGAAQLAGDVTSTGPQRYGSRTELAGAARTLTAETVVLEGAVAGDGATALTVAGALELGAAAGGLGALTVTGTSLLSGDVATAGAQRYLDGATLAGGSRRLAASEVTLASLEGGGSALVVDGALDLDGAAGNLSTLAVTGTADLAADVTASGAQRFDGTLTLRGGSRTLTAGSVGLGDGVTGATGTEALAITGDLDLTGAAGSLASLSVAGAARLAGDVSTSGVQRYAGPVSLAGPARRLTASEVRLAAPLVGVASPDLIVAGALDLGGAASGLGALTVNGPARVAADVVTAGAQDWQGALRLGADVALASGDAELRFGAPVSGEGFDVGLDAGDGTIRFAAPATGLGAVSLAAAGALRFEDALGAGSLTAGASDAAVAFLGPVTIAGATALATTGALTLGDDGDLLRFDGGLAATAAPAAAAATVRTAGAPLALGALRLGGPARFATADAAVPGGASLDLGAVNADGRDLVLDGGSAGAVTLASLSAARRLEVARAGTVTVTGAVDAAVLELGPLGSLTVAGDASLGALRTEDAGGASLAFLEDLAVVDPVRVDATGGLRLGDGTDDRLRFDGGLELAGAPATLAGRLSTPGAAVTFADLRLDADSRVDLGAGADLTVGGALTGEGAPDLEILAGTGRVVLDGGLAGLGSLAVRSAGELVLGGAELAGEGLRALVDGDVRLQGNVVLGEGDLSLFALGGRIEQAEDASLRALDGDLELAARDGMALFEAGAPAGDLRVLLLGDSPGATILRVGSFAKQTPDLFADGLISVTSLAPAEFGSTDSGFLIDAREQFFALDDGRAFVDGTTARTLATLSGSQEDDLVEVLAQTGPGSALELPLDEALRVALTGVAAGGSSFRLSTSLALQQRFQAQTQQTEEEAPLAGLTDAVFVDITLFDYDRERPLCLPAALHGPGAAPCAAAGP
mgnify:FL=1